MLTGKDILTRIRAAESTAPTGAFAVEISSNADVTGNLNSKHMYNQTVDKDNGIMKSAENKYLEKIAFIGLAMSSLGSMFKPKQPKIETPMIKEGENRYLNKVAALRGARIWTKQLGRNFKRADALTQFGVTTGVLGLGLSAGKYKADIQNAKMNMRRSALEERSLKALNGINKALSTAVIAPSDYAVKRPKGVS